MKHYSFLCLPRETTARVAPRACLQGAVEATSPDQARKKVLAKMAEVFNAGGKWRMYLWIYSPGVGRQRQLKSMEFSCGINRATGKATTG